MSNYEDDTRASPQGCAVFVITFFMLLASLTWMGRILRGEVTTSPATWDTSLDTGTESP
jgi:hypothetical protein